MRICRRNIFMLFKFTHSLHIHNYGSGKSSFGFPSPLFLLEIFANQMNITRRVSNFCCFCYLWPWFSGKLLSISRKIVKYLMIFALAKLQYTLWKIQAKAYSHRKNISSNQLSSTFFSKCCFHEFLSKICEMIVIFANFQCNVQNLSLSWFRTKTVWNNRQLIYNINDWIKKSLLEVIIIIFRH